MTRGELVYVVVMVDTLNRPISLDVIYARRSDAQQRAQQLMQKGPGVWQVFERSIL